MPTRLLEAASKKYFLVWSLRQIRFFGKTSGDVIVPL